MTLLVENRAGYKNLCRLLTAAARDRPKGDARATWDQIAEHAQGLYCLSGGEEGPVIRALATAGVDAARRRLESLAAIFGGRVAVELQRHRLREEEHRNRALVDLAKKLRLPAVATQGVRYARPEDKPLHDVLTAIRHRTTLDAPCKVSFGYTENFGFSENPIPSWALLAEPLNAREVWNMLPEPIFLAPRQQLKYVVTNSLDDVVISSDGNIEVLKSTV